MGHEDARKLSPAAQHERRRQVIRAHKRGRNRAQIAEEVGLSYTAVSNTLKRYAEAGMQGLASGGERTPGLLRPLSHRRAGRSCATADSREAPRAVEDGFCALDTCRGDVID